MSFPSSPSPPSPPSQAPTELVPTTDELLRQCPKLRILVLGKSGAGKSSLINRVFGVGVDVANVEHGKRGKHDINTPLKWPGNKHFILHDSQGFESGEKQNLQTVLDFIEKRSKMDALQDQLHAIWLCIAIPSSNGRVFEAGDERLLKDVDGTVPIFVVFTKLDGLYTSLETELMDENEADSIDMSEEEFKEVIDQSLNDQVQKLCVAPLRDIKPHAQWATVSVRPLLEERKTIEDFVSNVLKNLPEKVWLTWATAQRANASENIKASIVVGRKKYWRGLLSDIFVGFSMKKCLGVLCKDILRVWNMNDPDGHLRGPEFAALVSIIVQDLDDTNPTEYTWTKHALRAAENHPAAVIYAAPAAAVIFFAEWACITFKKSKNSLRCLMGFIVDLTLTLDTVFWLTQRAPVTRRSINTALKMYNSRKGPIHFSIKTWVDELGPLEHRKSDYVIEKIEELIGEHRFDPEGRAREGTQGADEAWLDPQELWSAPER
ncbi:hypothetical protein OF83DRAFT_1141694 [Amylostereum chailletii]|nr:hypothetical protein OF83DRAFT_1141694 [Amylostereum chailletii]